MNKNIILSYNSLITISLIIMMMTMMMLTITMMMLTITMMMLTITIMLLTITMMMMMLMLTDRRKRRMALSPDKKEAVKMRNTEGN